MTVDLTQEEMNILNLNGISAEDAKANVDMMRASGMDDKAIRESFDTTLSELKPLTKTSVNDTGKISTWIQQEGITPFEAGQREVLYGYVQYDNLNDNASLNPFQKFFKNQKEQRDKRINNGNASLLDKIDSKLEETFSPQLENIKKENGADPLYFTSKTLSNLTKDKNKEKPIGFWESLYENGVKNGSYLPFLGGFLSSADDKKALDIKDKILNNEEIRPDELDFINRQIEKKQEEAVRGYTLGGKIANGFLPSLIRFGSEMMTGGWVAKGIAAKFGLSGFGTAATETTANLLTKLKASEKVAQVGGKFAGGLTDMAATGAINTLLPTTYNDTYENYVERRMNTNQEFSVTPEGKVYFQQATEKPAITMVKSLGTTMVMFASEASGQLLSLPFKGVAGAASKYVGSPIGKYVMSQPKIANFVNKAIPIFSKAYEKINGLPIVGKNVDWLKDKVKFDGLLEEMGEEVVEDVLDLTLGLSGEERSLENYAKAIFKSPDEWAVIAGAVALQGGALSVGSHLLGSNMERNGATDDEIIEALNSLSESDKQNIAFEQFANGEYIPDVDKATQEMREETERVKQQLSQNLQNINMDKTDADAVAAAFANFGNRLTTGRKIYNERLTNKLEFTNQDVLKAVQDGLGEEATKETSPQELYYNYREMIDLYGKGEISEEEMEQATIDLEEYINEHPEVDFSKFENTPVTNEEINNEQITSAKEFADEIRAAINSGKLPSKKQTQKYSDAGHDTLRDIVLDAKKLFASNKRTNTAIDKRNQKSLSAISENEDTKNAVNNLAKKEKANASKELEQQKQKLIERVNNYLNEIGAIPQDQVMFQAAESAGAASGEETDAKKEYAKKKTNSKYFKKWFGDSYVKNPTTDKPIVVYHSSDFEFNQFKPRGSFDFPDAVYFSSSKAISKTYGDKLYACYLKIENPYIVDAHGQSYNDFYYHLSSAMDYAVRNDYDGVIVRNIRDDWGQNKKGGRKADTYIVFNPEQIKSVENQGTFDSNNANIFYQNTQSFDDELEGDPKVRKVRITNKNNAQVEINNSLWIPTEVMAMEGLNYDKQKIGAETWLDFKRRNLRDYDITKLERLSTSNTNNKTEEKQYDPEIESIAENYFGTTTNLKEAGYILNNGKLLDLSGKKFGGVAGRRSIDHREVVDAFIESENEDYQDIGFDEFIDNGAIRYMPEADTFLIAKMPSESQFEQLKKIIDSKNGQVSIEMVHGIDSWGKNGNFSKDYEQFSNPNKILDDVRTFFKGGKISPMKTYFQSNGYVSKANRIVNGIRNLFTSKSQNNNIQSTTITVQELLNNIPELDSIRYYFDGLSNIKVKLVYSLGDGTNGRYVDKERTVYIATSTYKNSNRAGFIATILHEFEHAHQHNEVRKYRKKLNDNNTTQDEKDLYERLLENRNETSKANSKFQKFKKAHKEDYIKALRLKAQKRLNLPKFKKYKQIHTQWRKLYNNYKNSIGEVDAEYATAQMLDTLGLGEQYERELSRGLPEWKVYRSYRSTIFQRVNDRIRIDKRRSGSGTTGNFGFTRFRNGIKTFFQSAYHGSAAKFDKFNTDFMGTGEGNQAHGWGLYFAGNKNVSENYRKGLIRTKELTYKGVPYNDVWWSELAREIYEKPELLKKRLDKAKERKEILDKIISDLTEKLKKTTDKSEIKTLEEAIDFHKGSAYEHNEKTIDFYENLDVSQLKISEPSNGQLYEVDIPESDVLLNEDKRFSEQPEKVQKALIKLADENLSTSKKELFNFSAIPVGVYLNGKEIGEGEFAEFPISIEIAKRYGKNIAIENLNNEKNSTNFNDMSLQEARETIARLDEYIEYIKNLNLDNITIDERKFNKEEFENKYGEQIYNYIAKFLGSPKNASILLNQYGIKGITYNGMQDGRCYVIFDDAAVNIIQTFYQELGDDVNRSDYESIKNYLDYKREKEKEKANGYFTKKFGEKDLIVILNSNNKSTIMHELGHWYIETLEKIKYIDEEAQRQLDLIGGLVGHIDGEQWTVQQHERFARSFEAYLFSGKAQSNAHRNMFEKFREWFRNVYSSIEQLIAEAKGNIDVSDEAKEVFDRIFFGDNVVEERKRARELASKVKNIVAELSQDQTGSINTEMKAEAIRILSAATNKKESYYERIFSGRGENVANNSKKMAKTKENIGKVIEELVNAGDILSSGDNSIKGYSYKYYVEANDIAATGDGGAALVEQVYNDLLNNNFAYEVYTDKYDNYLDDADAQYNYLLNLYRETYSDDTKQESERSIVLSAFMDWIESVPAEFQETYTDKFMADTNQIERKENVDKFEKVKQKIIDKAKETRSYNNKKNIDTFRTEIINILRGLKFLTAEDKAKLLVNILETPNNTFLEARINNIVDIAKTMDDISFRKDLMNKIHQELMGTKNIKQGARTVGKYDYMTNKIFEQLREYDELSVEQADEKRLNLKGLATAEDEGFSFENRIINEFIQYKANGMKYADTDQIKQLYDDIVKIKLAGKTAKDERDLLDKLNNQKDVEELAKILESKKVAKETTKTYINWFGNAESTLNAIFNKHIANKYGSSILQAETDSMVWIYEKKKEFESEVAKIFNLPQWNWDRKILDNLAEKHTFNEFIKEYDVNGDVIRMRAIPKEMNKMEMILAWMWNMNDVLSKRLENQFGEDGLAEMFSLLTEEDMQLGALMIKTVNSFYPEVNEMFIKKYGLDMPKVQCYFPSTPERAASEIDLLNEYNQQGLNTGFTKQRSKSETLTMSFHNPIQTLYSHIDGVGKFIKMTDILDKSNKVLKDRAIKRLITNKYGEDAQKTLNQILANVSYKAKAATYSGFNKVLNNIIQNWVQGNVILRPIVGLKQLLSANNYAVDMPYMDWQVGFLKALSHPKQTIDYMMKIPYLKARFGGNYSNEFLQQAIENSKFAATKKLKDYLSLNIKLGDIGAIIFGGKPYIDYLIKQGKTEKEAIDLFILSTQRSQQSGAVSSLSNLQVSASNHPFAKVFTAYKNSPQQYVRMCGDAIVSVANGDMTKKQCAKVLFQYLYIQPLFYTMAGSGSLLRLLLAGDDDDLLADLRSSLFNLNSSAIPVLGDIYQFALNKLLYKNKYLPQTTPLLGDIEQEISKLAKDDVSLADYLSFLGMMVHVTTGVDAKAAGNMASSIGDIVNGDLAEGALKAIGYTKKRAKHITGD